LFVVSSGLLLITLDNSILYTVLPVLGRDLKASQSQLLWIVNMYPLVMAGLLLGAGTLGDRIGHRRIFIAGLLVFAAASLLAAFAPTPAVLIAARGVLAVGAAMMMPATLALIRVSFEDEKERTLAFALWGMLAIIGAALGPVLGGALLDRFWWGSVFLINVPVVLLALMGTVFFAPRVEPDPSKHWDLLSSIQAMLMLGGLVLAIKEFAHGVHPMLAMGALALSLLAAVAFVQRQGRLEFPLLDFAVFRNPALMAGVLAAGFSLFAIAGVQLMTTQKFQLVEGYTPLEAGYLVSIIALSCIPTALIGGTFLHRIGLRILISGGLAICATGILITAFGAVSGQVWLMSGLITTGLGIGAALSVASAAILGNAPAHRAGMAGAVEEVSYELGALLAVALLGSLSSAIYAAGASFPSGTPVAASESIVAAVAIGAQMGEGGQALLAEAGRAFDAAYIYVLLVVAFALISAALLTAILLRNHGPGSQSMMQQTLDH
jgi:DHA2 family multidrug resistance protein-like MFS transporter